MLEMRKKKSFFVRHFESLREKFGICGCGGGGGGGASKRPKIFNVQLDKVHSLFIFSWPRLYFYAVEFALLLQSFFNAIYFTQLLAIGNSLGLSSAEGSGWLAALTIPIFSNFWIIRGLLTRTVMLKAITYLDQETVSSVCEQVVEEVMIVESVREKIIQNMLAGVEGINEGRVSLSNSSTIISIVRNAFDVIDENNSGGIDMFEFRSFLGQLDIHLTRSKFELLWGVVDYDLSGIVSFDEIFIFIFPELKNLVRDNLDVTKKLKGHFTRQFAHLPRSQWEDMIREAFDRFDLDGSGHIDISEFNEMLLTFNCRLGTKQLRLLIETLTQNDSGLIGFKDFKALLFGDDISTLEEEVRNFTSSSSLESMASVTTASGGGTDDVIFLRDQQRPWDHVSDSYRKDEVPRHASKVVDKSSSPTSSSPISSPPPSYAVSYDPIDSSSSPSLSLRDQNTNTNTNASPSPAGWLEAPVSFVSRWWA